MNDALRIVEARPTGRINIRGGNGTGKSSLLASLKTEMRQRAFYWPASDRLAFQFAGGVVPVDVEGDDDENNRGRRHDGQETWLFDRRAAAQIARGNRLFDTDARIYLLDEWDANLDAANKAKADALVDALAARARVVEISHRDRAA